MPMRSVANLADSGLRTPDSDSGLRTPGSGLRTPGFSLRVLAEACGLESVAYLEYWNR